jgi:hypothetical protein
MGENMYDDSTQEHDDDMITMCWLWCGANAFEQRLYKSGIYSALAGAVRTCSAALGNFRHQAFSNTSVFSCHPQVLPDPCGGASEVFERKIE